MSPPPLIEVIEGSGACCSWVLVNGQTAVCGKEAGHARNPTAVFAMHKGATPDGVDQSWTDEQHGEDITVIDYGDDAHLQERIA